MVTQNTKDTKSITISASEMRREIANRAHIEVSQENGATYHIPHRIPLETKLLREVKENVFNLLL